jgi:hypothetical protein
MGLYDVTYGLGLLNGLFALGMIILAGLQWLLGKFASRPRKD